MPSSSKWLSRTRKKDLMEAPSCHMSVELLYFLLAPVVEVIQERLATYGGIDVPSKPPMSKW